MCGIHAVISCSSIAPSDLTGTLRQSLHNRGPDHLGQVTRSLPLPSTNNDNGTDSPAVHLNFTSTVLALRGDHIAPQPLCDPSEDGSVLCWNGEAWRLDGQPVAGNDGEIIQARLRRQTLPDDATPAAREHHILSVFRSIQGPFAVVYYDSDDRRVYFGRDRLGRRSLLVHKARDGRSVSFSSVAGQPVTDWQEVPADGLYSLSLDAFVGGAIEYDVVVQRHAWLVGELDVNMVSSGDGTDSVCKVHTEFPVSRPFCPAASSYT